MMGKVRLVGRREVDVTDFASLRRLIIVGFVMATLVVGGCAIGSENSQPEPAATTATVSGVVQLDSYPAGSELKCGWWADELYGGYSYRGLCDGRAGQQRGLDTNPNIACIPGDPYTRQFPGCPH